MRKNSFFGGFLKQDAQTPDFTSLLTKMLLSSAQNNMRKNEQEKPRNPKTHSENTKTENVQKYGKNNYFYNSDNSKTDKNNGLSDCQNKKVCKNNNFSQTFISIDKNINSVADDYYRPPLHYLPKSR